MNILINRVISAVENGETVVLCTILASSGSSPREAGTRMAVFSNGTICGTVGGGRAEHLAAQEAREVLNTGRTRLRSFSLVADQGGSDAGSESGITIFYQLLTPAELPTLCRIRDAIETEERHWLLLQIEEGYVKDFRVLGAQDLGGQSYSTPTFLENGARLTYIEPLPQLERVYVFGGGHVGQALVPVLAGVGFRVTLFDQRGELATPERFPAAERVICGDYRNLSAQISLRDSDYIIIMTSEYQTNFILLEQVLRRPMRYVGCIGSRNKIARVRQLLREAGIPEERILSVHSPIGLPIQAQTPAEIAISIAAEMILCRAQNR